MTNRLQIHFTGGDIAPATTGAKDLAKVLTAFEAAIAAVAAQERGVKAEQVIVSLSGIQEGSLNLEFDSPWAQPVYEAADLLLSSIENKEWGRVPAPALRGVREIVSFTKSHKCTAHLSSMHDSKRVSTVLTPELKIPVSAIIYGETELTGTVTRVGGADPKVGFRTIQEQLLFCPTTTQLAKELAQYLYEEITVAGVATLDFETLAITDFEITRFIAQRTLSPSQGFKELRKNFGHYFDDIADVDAWSHEIRHGG
ncbi:MAG: hypothetical protein AAF702_08075 [Chloroflexota bacterium]